MNPRLWAAAAILLALAACSKNHPTAPVAASPVSTGPAADTPAGAVHRFAWAWVHRDTAVYASVFTDDYQFVFAANDSAGSPWRGVPWERPDEMQCGGHLFVGGTDLPPASDVALVVDNLLLDEPDPRPGAASRWHRFIRTHVDLKLTVTYPDGTPSVGIVSGYARFYLVRGDSAALSPARIAAGGRDSTRWYIDRWEDQTVGSNGPGLHTDPTRQQTWGSIKVLYW